MTHYKDRPTHLPNRDRTDHATHVEKLIQMGGLPTQLSFFHEIGEQNPGFFTQFGKKTYSIHSTKPEIQFIKTETLDMSFQKAVIAAFGMPYLKLQDALLTAFAIPMNLGNIIRSAIAGDIENSLHSLLNVGRNLKDTSISIASFAFQFIKEVTALMTRAVTTLLSCLLIPLGLIDAEDDIDDIYVV